MIRYRIEPNADRRIDEIVAYTQRRWGDEQAVAYIDGLFAEFAAIAARRVPWSPLPASFELSGFRRRWRRHVIYWKIDDAGEVAIVSILHERMEQRARLLDDLSGPAQDA